MSDRQAGAGLGRDFIADVMEKYWRSKLREVTNNEIILKILKVLSFVKKSL